MSQTLNICGMMSVKVEKYCEKSIVKVFCNFRLCAFLSSLFICENINTNATVCRVHVMIQITITISLKRSNFQELGIADDLVYCKCWEGE